MPLFTCRATTGVDNFYEKPATAGESVAPTSYDVHTANSSFLTEYTPEHQVPFGGLEDRPHPAKASGSAMRSPGPGTYDLRPERTQNGFSAPNAHIGQMNLSKSAFRSRSARISPFNVPGSSEFMASSILDNPGPGTYSPPTSIVRSQSALPRPRTESSVDQIAMMSRSLPSIPTEMGRRNTRTRRYSADERHQEDSLGPGDYERGNLDACRRSYRPTDFGATKKNRDLFDISRDPRRINPSPDRYNVRRSLVSRDRGTNFFNSQTNQRFDMATGKDKPGPGAYLAVESAIGQDGNEDMPASSMRSKTLRSQWAVSKSTTPGPGQYKRQPAIVLRNTRRGRSDGEVLRRRRFYGVSQPQLLTSLQQNEGLHLCGFNTSSTLPGNKPTAMYSGASPGTYEHDDQMGQSILASLKERKGVGRKGIFGTTASLNHEKWLITSSPDVPAPGSYHRPRTAAHITGCPCKVAFTSQNTRIAREAAKEGPEPATYDPKITHDYRSKFRQARTAHLSFGSGHARWNPNEVYIGMTFTPSPGPGEYNAKVAGRGVGFAKSSQSRLGKGPKDPGLGPGAYNVEKSLLRQTFNVSAEEAADKSIVRSNSWHGKPVSSGAVGGGGAGGGHAAMKARMARSDSGWNRSTHEASTSSLP
eukprot:gnl/TRDRNA2_/TRDRNA2_185932_c0_seq1.p1 gnl/TRDRNA2_/TRDRNA2_185932_c0~~gnl/TRDRNA2_/TRDRNA2_185932_c0_seq1.p1  ORF type:complete len:671 (+),score=56.45 gnl/TRDRNA2_/TRDRNA2_185932_c0_seq1:81-2015(+)